MRANARRYAEFLDTIPDASLLLDRTARIIYANSHVEALLGHRPAQLKGRPVHALLHDPEGSAPLARIVSYVAAPRGQAVHTIKDVHARHDEGHPVPVDIMLTPRPLGRDLLTLCIVRDMTTRQDLRRDLQRSEERYRTLVEHASEVFYAVDVGADPMRGQVTYVSPQAGALTGCAPEAFVREPSLWVGLIHPSDLPAVAAATGELLANRRPATREYRVRHRGSDTYRWVEDRVVPRHDAKGRLIGYQGVARDVTERWWQQYHLQTMVSLAGSLRQANSRAELIDALLNGLLTLVDANGSALFEREEDEGEIVCEQGRGVLAEWTGKRDAEWRSVNAAVMQTGAPFVTNNADDDPALVDEILPSAVRAYASLPLHAKGRLLGALAVTKPRAFVEREIQVLRAIAEMAATAIQRQRLHEQVMHSAASLEETYERTIEGWTRVLDMRDRATAGHTNRVTSLTLRVARALGVPDDQLPHLRRGAMLHDIGKVAIPDHILRKAGPLTTGEQAVMRRHVDVAVEMLWPIDFLRPALDIPRFHHERWDGSGYPHGLQGDAIPLAARIFAVVDVFDAITSERPYAPAEPVEQALDFVVKASGRLFDPAVVAALLAVCREAPTA